MNLFFLDKNPDKCAAAHVDRHCVKMILESAQILSNAYGGKGPYKISHINHPMCVWARASRANFRYVVAYMEALCREYTFRYGKVHKSSQHLEFFRNAPEGMVEGQFSQPPRCFGELKGILPETDCFVSDYRRYYNNGKRHLFKWKVRGVPDWVVGSMPI